jgi:outer membrane protein assembly factor BamB
MWYKNPPIIHEDMVYWANDRHEVFAQKLETGEIIWQWQGPRPNQDKGITSEIQVYKDRIYVTSYDGALYCFNRFTGKLLINHRLDYFIHSTPVINEEKQELYVATEGGIQNKRGDIVALDLMSGTLKWRVPTEDVVPASPYIYKNQILCGSNDGYLYSVTDGVLNWRVKLGVIKGKINSINSTLIASTEDGKLYGLDEQGNILWTRTTGTSTRHQFVQVHDAFKLAYVVSEDGYALAYDEFGNQKWIRRLRGVCAWNMRLRGDEILIVSETGYTVILDPATGEKKQMSSIGTFVTCPADFNQDYIVIHTVKKGLITYRRDKLCQD